MISATGVSLPANHILRDREGTVEKPRIFRPDKSLTESRPDGRGLCAFVWPLRGGLYWGA